MDLLVRNGWIPDRGGCDLKVVAGRIAAIGPGLEAPPEVPRIDAGGMAIMPGLVNGHTHAAMTLFRGFGDDLPLDTLLRDRLWPVEARMDEESVYWGTRLACLEMIRSGTLVFWDMYWHFHGMARAVEEMGLRCALGVPMIDVAGPEQGRWCREEAIRLHEESSRYSERIHLTVTPHAIYSVSLENLEWVAGFAAERGVAVQLHLAETRREVTDSLERTGLRPAFLLDRVGLLHPRVLLAHGVHLDAEELDLIAARGATLVTNPVSNMKLAVGGVFPYSAAQRRGIPLALGTDGPATNNGLDLFQDMKILALLQKQAQADPTLLPAAECWRLATGRMAPLLGGSGRVEVGERADFLLIDRETPELCPGHDFISDLVYAASGQVVDTAVVAGRVLMRHRVIAGEAEIRREAAAQARRLCR
ncbi:MAG: amidohydrolase [Magnetococcales bacterium]|nr:amidohydrolase [Magnetococcales bacterium]